MPIFLKDGINYYLHTFSPSTWKEYMDTNAIKINKNYNLKKLDILFLFIRAKPKHYFFGIIQLKNNQVKDKYILTDFESVEFDEKIYTKNMYEILGNKLPLKKKTMKAFQMKYLSKPDIIIGLPDCSELIDDLLEDASEDKSSEKEKEESESDICISMDDSSSSNSEEETENKEIAESSDGSSDDSDDISECEDGGLIPIIMIPCKKFNLIKLKKYKLKYFKKHYQTCTICEKVDNNPCPLSNIIDTMDGEVFEIIEKKDMELELALPYYYSLKRCPMDEGDAPYMRIGIIDNGHAEYDQCLIICCKIKN